MSSQVHPLNSVCIPNRGSGQEVTNDAGFALPVAEYMEQSKIVGFLRKHHAKNTQKKVDAVLESKEPGHIVLIEGAMSSSALRDLMKRCNAKAHRELLQYHFPSSGVFPTDKLPSRPKPFATARFITIGSYTQDAPGQPVSDQMRSEVAARLAHHHQDCLGGNRNGFDCFRAVTMHSKSFFTVEQQATFFTLPEPSNPGLANNNNNNSNSNLNGSRWSGVLTSDFGKLNDDFRLPWCIKKAQFRGAGFLSFGSSDLNALRFRYEPHGAVDAAGEWGSSSSQQGDAAECRFLSRPDPFRSRSIDGEAMSPEARRFCSQYPFVFAADLFETSALCWDQAVNFLRHTVEQDLPPDATERVRVLTEIKGLVDRAARYFAETIQFIESRELIGWPFPDSTSKDDEGPHRHIAVLANRLKRDFAGLTNEADKLSASCQAAIEITMNGMSVLASQQSLQEGKRSRIVSVVAFIFIPISLVSSCFGMNVKELSGDKVPPISLAAYSFAGALGLSLLFPLYLLNKPFRNLVDWLLGWALKPVKAFWQVIYS